MVDNVSKSQRRQDKHGEFFRKIAEQGHYGGRTVPTDTRQGLYTATADGKLLVSVNSTQVGRVQRLLGDAVRIWKNTSRAERSPKFDKTISVDKNYLEIPPEDGLVLRMITRDLPRDDKVRNADPTANNFDHIWFKKDEMLSMVPDDPKEGQLFPLPKVVAERFARFNLLDSVRGETHPYDENQVKIEGVGLKVMKVTPETIKFVVYGRSIAKRPPSNKTNPYSGIKITREMGTDLRWSGAVVFDRKQRQFNRFDLLAAGDRWGGSLYNFRDKDPGPNPIGFAFQLVPNVEDDPTPPSFYRYYR